MWAYVLAVAAFALAAQAELPTDEPQHGEAREAYFKTEPTFVVEFFDIEIMTENKSALAPGHLFLDPMGGGTSTGPQIYEQDGTLVWYGGVDDEHRVQDFHSCDYLGTKGQHLCWSEMLSNDDINNRNPSNKMIFDSSYQRVEALNISIGDAQPNLHEFNLVDNGTSYVQPVYPGYVVDLSEYGGRKDGFMWDGCFQDIDVASKNILFQWCWHEHYPIWETTIWFEGGPNTTNITSHKAGQGTWASPFDPFHLNAIDKNEEGDYLISGRHADQILKIAGNNNTHGVAPGTTLWRFGGPGNEFEFEGETFHFSKQHHARFRGTSGNETIVSFLDNASEGTLAPTSKFSSGMVVALNNETMTARLIGRYPNPDGAIAGSQASMQVLPNGNAFIGWGQLPQISEYAKDGKVLFHAVWRRFRGELRNEHSYRAFKSVWVGHPIEKPKLVAYSLSCSIGPASPLMAWVSWNGATEVRQWRFHLGTSALGPWLPIGTYDKVGFETQAVLINDTVPSWLKSIHLTRAPFVAVDALDIEGHVLDSQVTETFVPVKTITENCGPEGCYTPADRFDYPDELSCGSRCERSQLPQLIALVLFICIIEYLDYSYLSLAAAWVMPELRWRYAVQEERIHISPRPSEKFSHIHTHSRTVSFQLPHGMSPITPITPADDRPAWAPGHRSRPSYAHNAI